MEDLISHNKIKIPRAVYDEIDGGADDDPLKIWSKKYKKTIVLKHTADMEKFAYELIRKYPKLSKITVRNPVPADPYVIATVRHYLDLPTLDIGGKNVVMITDDNLMLDVAKNFKINCMKLLSMFRSEDWKF